MLILKGGHENGIRVIGSPYEMISYKMTFVHYDRFKLIYKCVHIDRIY